jgi:hypothetical protein
MPSVGDFYFIDPDGGTNPHPWMVIAEADGLLLVCVNASSKPRGDKTCTLTAADHPALTGTCYVRYQDMRKIPRNAACFVASKRRDPVSVALLARVRQGAHDSPWTADDMLRHIPDPRVVATLAGR